MKRLLLFDIDGTLMLLDNVADRAFKAMGRELFGIEASLYDIRFSGKTDSQIFEEILSGKGVTRDEFLSKRTLAFDRYSFYFKQYLQDGDGYRIYPGVIPLLENLAKTDSVYLGLVTGNIEFTAWKKLEKAGLRKYFAFGAFGNESKDRSELVGIALQRAHERLQISFQGREIVIIGDSVHDVECGKRYGARSIAVATGFHTWEELTRALPDILLDDLGNYRAVIQAILS